MGAMFCWSGHWSVFLRIFELQYCVPQVSAHLFRNFVSCVVVSAVHICSLCTTHLTHLVILPQRFLALMLLSPCALILCSSPDESTATPRYFVLISLCSFLLSVLTALVPRHTDPPDHLARLAELAVRVEGVRVDARRERSGDDQSREPGERYAH